MHGTIDLAISSGHIEVVGEPRRVYSSLVKGYESLPERFAAWYPLFGIDQR